MLGFISPRKLFKKELMKRSMKKRRPVEVDYGILAIYEKRRVINDKRY